MTRYHWLDDYGAVVRIRDYPPPPGQNFRVVKSPRIVKPRYPLPEWEDAPF